ncbi:cytochrome P450 [Boeremia exigua]|uniref:cytochrome P450 n=1 Tax=Boeremia exigua TaxID=749465 RepID=UPI001E8E0AC8|nr:cytochrome P450 [Boeremia exigua]KAH6638120.1 cytochrome P450 [Boeremia exigua]
MSPSMGNATHNPTVRTADSSSSLPIIVFTSIIAALGYFVLLLVQRRRFYKDLPKPPHSLLWGHLKLMGEIFAILPKNSHIQIAVTTISQKYDLPGIFYLDLWPLSTGLCLVTDPDLAHYMTVTRNHEKHSVEARDVDPLIGEGNVVTSEGTRWKKMHKMLAPAFAIMHVTNMRSMIGQNVMQFRAILAKLADAGEAFEFEKYMGRLALDVVGSATFGHSLDAQAMGDACSVIQHWEDMTRANIHIRDRWKIDFVRNYMAFRKRDAAKKKFDAILTKLVQERFDYVRDNDVNLEKRKDSIIIDLILREYLQDAAYDNQQGLNPVFLDDVLTQIRTLIVGGTGTVTDTVCFVYMLLSGYPDVVQRLREEHDQVFAPGIDASYDILCSEPYKLNKLDYTTNVIKEALRLYPVGCTARREHSDGFLPYDGRQYTTKGFLILPVGHTMHLNPEVFPNPKAFDPDRFAREDFPRHAFRSFERGPRACMGQPLAMDEMKIILLLTVRDFDFTCVGLKPNKTPRVPWTDLDLTFGDRAFQEYVFESKPRDGMLMSMKKSHWK